MNKENRKSYRSLYFVSLFNHITYWNYFTERTALKVSGTTIPESFSRHLNFKDDLIQSHLECEYVFISLYLLLLPAREYNSKSCRAKN